MIFIFKTALLIVDIALSLAMFFLATKSMKTDHLRIKGEDGAKMKEYKSYFKNCLILSVIVKFVYWLIIPDKSNMISFMIVISIFIFLLIDVLAFIYMLPMHRINKEKYAKCSVASSVFWIMRSAVCVLVMFALAYIISAPVIW